MALTLQEISDRFEITDLLTDYCTAIDTRNIDAFDHNIVPYPAFSKVTADAVGLF